MYIGVISDTHGQVASTILALEAFHDHDVRLVLHCGDIGSPRIVPPFSPWPTHFVFGNVDGDPIELREAIREAGQQCHERFGTLEVEGVRIAFLHGDDESLLRRTVHSGHWDLVCTGHSHVAGHSYKGRTLVLNPGAIHRASPRSVAMVEVPSLSVKSITL
ncbi:MAG: YfcE family phosphodiesterase [Pirellulales bacterium]